MVSALAPRPRPWDDASTRPGFGSIRYYGAPGQEFWGVPDSQLKAMIAAAPAALGRIIKTVTEGTPLGLFSNENGGTWGAARFAGGSERRLFARLASRPELRGSPYRAIFAAAATPARGATSIDAPGLREAWWVVARQPWAQRAYWDQWADSILAPALAAWRVLGWKSERGLAALVRARNSSGAMLSRVVAAATSAKIGRKSEAEQVEAALSRYAAETPRYAERAAEIRRDHPITPIDAPRIRDLDPWAATPRRPSGAPVEPSPNSPAAAALRFAPYIAGAALVAYLLRARLRALLSRHLTPRLKRLTR